MPKETFSNLNEAKKKQILKSFQMVFYEKDLSKITVSDLVEAAEIPRGSFYQYFEDLDDVFEYMKEYALDKFEVTMMNRIKNKKLTFFEYLKESFDDDYKIIDASTEHRIIVKFMHHSGPRAMNFDSYRKRKDDFYSRFLQSLDTKELSGLSEARMIGLYYNISHLKFQNIIKVIHKRLSYNEAKENYYWFLDIVRAGLKETLQ